MLTFHSDYTSLLGSPFKENWVVRLYKNDGTYIGISFADVTMGDSIVYKGSILNAPSIRDDVDFTSGKAKTSNMTLEVADYAISSSTLQKTLYTGNYLNQSVKVYSTLGTLTDFAKIPQLFEGRLESVSTNEKGNLKLSIVVKRPWDEIQLPNVFSTNGVYAPVVYGDYTSNQYADTSGYKLYPAPFLTSDSTNLRFADHQSVTNVFPHYFDSSARQFPYLSRASATSASKLGVDSISILDTITRLYRIVPSMDPSDAGDFSNPTNIIDTSVSTFAQSVNNVHNSNHTDTLKINLPQLSGKITSVTMYVKFDATYLDNEQSPSNQVKFSYDAVYGGSTTEGIIFNDTDPNTVPSSAETVTSSGNADINNSGTAHGSYSLTSLITSNDNKLPDAIHLKHFVAQSNSSSNETLDSTLKIYDVWFSITIQTDTSNEPSSAGQEKAQLEKVYLAHDGFTKSWQTNTLAEKPHDIHRDILYRFLGVTTTPTNYSSLDSEKSGVMRFFTSIGEPKNLKEYLDKLAYEGGFVFRFRVDGTPVYHFVPNSPSITTGLTLSHNDIIDLSITHTGLSSVVTKWNVKYEKNPAKNEYNSSTTHTSSARTNYYTNTSKENVKEIKLNFLTSNVSHTGGNKNASFLDYYNSLIGDVKQLIAFKLVNPVKSYIEVGDIINFDNSNMNIESLSGAWTNLKFIVTSTNRTTGGAVDVSAREI